VRFSPRDVRNLAAIPALLSVLAGAAPSIEAQPPRRSQRASVMQMLGTTRVEITYSRPVARGRALFGALVPWDRVWHPGADTATTLSTSAPLRIQGQLLPMGTYSVWTIPGEREWTLIFSAAQPVWHTPYPEGRDILRVRTVPERGAHMETLAFYFPLVEGLQATLLLHWGETVVPLRLEAQPPTSPGAG
jgi:hypothetical protein